MTTQDKTTEITSNLEEDETLVNMATEAEIFRTYTLAAIAAASTATHVASSEVFKDVESGQLAIHAELVMLVKVATERAVAVSKLMYRVEAGIPYTLQ